MSRSPRDRAAVAFALVGASVTLPAFARGPSAEATHFELRAPEGCSSVEDFSARVRKRSARILLVSGPAPRSLLVEIREPSPGVLRGSVRVVEPGGRARSRQLKASSCAEAVDALALIATVTLDPDALLAEPEPEPESEPPASPPEVEPEAPPRQPPRRAPPPSPPVPATPAYRLSLGLGAALLVHRAPGVVPGGAAALALELRPGRVWAPFVRLSVVHAQRRDIPEPGGAASFAFTLPVLDVCPVRLGPRQLGIRPCAYGSVGMLKAWGSATSSSESHVRLSGSGGGALWLGVRVSEVFEIVGDCRVGVLFPRDRFGFDDRGFFTTPLLGYAAGLGVAGGFP